MSTGTFQAIVKSVDATTLDGTLATYTPLVKRAYLRSGEEVQVRVLEPGAVVQIDALPNQDYFYDEHISHCRACKAIEDTEGANATALTTEARQLLRQRIAEARRGK